MPNKLSMIRSREKNNADYRMNEWTAQTSMVFPPIFDISIPHRISSDNNSRKYNGTTYIEDAEIPSVQRLNLNDGRIQYVYEVEFSDDELQSNETFCRGIFKLVSSQYNYSSVTLALFCEQISDKLLIFPEMILGADGYVPDQSIDPNALKSLIG